MIDHPTTPNIHVSLPAAVGLIVAALTLSALYWKNALDIAHLRDDMKAAQSMLASEGEEIHKLQLKVGLLEKGK